MAELDGLRREALHVVPGTPFTAQAFDIDLGDRAGRASLSLVDGSGERLVAVVNVGHSTVAPPRILVDASMVEVFDGSPTPFTTRAYPTSTSEWILRLDRPHPPPAWRLAR